MPEGDTVWLTGHRLDEALSGRVVTTFDLRVPDLATADLRGATITAVRTRGKHILTRFDTDVTLHSHLRMDGAWYLTRAGVAARRYPSHLIRARVGNAEWQATGFRVHDLRLLPTADEGLLVDHLGPDLLGPDWNAELAVERLLRAPDVAVGEALLDQRNLAGIGNLYKSETLFMQRVNPFVPVSHVHDLRAVVDRAHRLMRGNRDHPEQSTTGLLGRGQQHWVYQRAGEACRRCRTPIRRDAQGSAPFQRTTFWCPTCQVAGSDG
jgi:endonuclease-8